MLSILETRYAQVPDTTSLDARLFGSAILFGGIGYFFGKLREFSSNTTHMTSGFQKRIHDSIFTAGVYASLTSPVYKALGINNTEQIIDATISIGTYGLIAGVITGYAIDKFNNKDPEKVLRNIALATTLATSATIANYELTPDQSFENARIALEDRRNEKIALTCKMNKTTPLFYASGTSQMCLGLDF